MVLQCFIHISQNQHLKVIYLVCVFLTSFDRGMFAAWSKENESLSDEHHSWPTPEDKQKL